MRDMRAQAAENRADVDNDDDASDDEVDADDLRAADERLARFNAENDGSWGNLRLGWQSLLAFDNVPLQQKLIIVAAVALQIGYALFPVDLLPEAAFGVIGLLDDMLFIVLIFIALGMGIRNMQD